MSTDSASQPGAPLLDVSVVVPVYGGEQTLRALAEQLHSSLTQAGLRYELLLVCDRPRDGSWAVAKALATSSPHVRAWLLQRNFGQHPATLLGIRSARGAILVTMDEDLQHDPRDVPALVQAAKTGEALVYGVSAELHHGLFRNSASRLLKWFMARYLGVQNAQHLSAFRAFPQQLRQAFEHYRSPNVAVDVLLSWAGPPVQVVRCAHAPRAAGRSGYTLAKLLHLMTNLVFGFTTAPLRAAIWLGVVAIGIAVLLAAYVLVTWMQNGSAVPGFAFLALTMVFFGGTQLVALGLVGEYIGRLYLDNLNKPQYLVAAHASAADAAQRPSTEQ